MRTKACDPRAHHSVNNVAVGGAQDDKSKQATRLPLDNVNGIDSIQTYQTHVMPAADNPRKGVLPRGRARARAADALCRQSPPPAHARAAC